LIPRPETAVYQLLRGVHRVCPGIQSRYRRIRDLTDSKALSRYCPTLLVHITVRQKIS
jgi:hypothetical protein